MIKKILFTALMLLLIMPVFANYRYSRDFLEAVESVNDNTTSVDGVGHDSRDIDISTGFSVVNITVEFLPAVPAAVSIDFEYQASTDGGRTWTTGLAGDAYIRIRVNTDVDSIDEIVRITGGPFNVHGVWGLRLYRIVVGDGAGNCTGIQTNVSY